MEEKIKAYVIERADKEWSIVGMTRITEDGIWHSGETLITSIEDVIEMSAKNNVPIWTREYMDNLKKVVNK
jgi:hypothetical protein